MLSRMLAFGSTNLNMIFQVADSERDGTDIYDTSDADPFEVLRRFRGFVDREMLQKSVTLPEFNDNLYQDEPVF